MTGNGAILSPFSLANLESFGSGSGGSNNNDATDYDRQNIVASARKFWQTSQSLYFFL